MKWIFSEKYTVDMGDHVFPTVKFALVAQKLVKDGVLSPGDRVEPEPAAREDLLLVHTASWVDKVLDGRLTPADLETLELPYSPELVLAHRLAVFGTTLAARVALQTGLGLHVGGGSHHATADHGEGFCMFNDLAVAVRVLLREGRIRRAAVVDLDVHQGNGTAAAFAGSPEVFTFSMHQEDNYPAVKPPSSLDIGLADGTGDAEYLRILGRELPRLLEGHRPDLVVYQAGADSFAQDLLGGLKLTREGLAARDRTVFEECFRRGVAVAVTLGGGYAARLEDTVGIHAETIRISLQCHKRLWTQRKGPAARGQ